MQYSSSLVPLVSHERICGVNVPRQFEYCNTNVSQHVSFLRGQPQSHFSFLHLKQYLTQTAPRNDNLPSQHILWFPDRRQIGCPFAIASMQTMSLIHTPLPVSGARLSVNRSLLPSRFAQPRRIVGGIRAKSDNTGPSITNSGKTEKPDSYQVRMRSILTLHTVLAVCICSPSLLYRKSFDPSASIFAIVAMLH